MLEVNFDGIVGPTHNYGGLSYGNIASMTNKGAVSNPKEAVRQGLRKMRLLHDLGAPQGVLPPHPRPHLETLRRLGFEKIDNAPLEILIAVSSASAMWTANAATVSPSCDTADGKVHFTPASLVTGLHRAIETETTAKILRTIFADERYFVHHEPLPATTTLADEGAANHMRFSNGHEVFVYGERSIKFPIRQKRAASEAVARLHRLKSVSFLEQNPKAIDAGAFHNDVVAVSHENLLLHHEDAWTTAPDIPDIDVITITNDELPLEDAVRSYIFNSQIIGSTLIAPIESRGIELEKLRRFRIEYVDTRSSMRNGGGPACLRLRIPLTDEELAAIKGRVILDEDLYNELWAWTEKYYRDELRPEDLRDPKLHEESDAALEELSRILE